MMRWTQIVELPVDTESYRLLLWLDTCIKQSGTIPRRRGCIVWKSLQKMDEIKMMRWTQTVDSDTESYRLMLWLDTEWDNSEKKRMYYLKKFASDGMMWGK